MTCEVAVMNRYAAMLAADSAVTTTRGTTADNRPRFSKGGNKIFQLSDYEAVGVMIYNTAALDGMPWEIVVKQHRAALGRSTCKSIDDYAKGLFSFISQDRNLFPHPQLEESFTSLIARSALQILQGFHELDPKRKDKTAPLADRQNAWSTYFAGICGRVAAAPVPPEFTQQAIDTAISDHAGNLGGEIQAALPLFDLDQVLAADDLAKVSIARAYKDFETVFDGNYTGVVVAGFGNDDFFPGLVEYKCFGFVRDVLVFRKTKEEQVSVKQASIIEPFATTSMVQTFTQGYTFDVWFAVHRFFHEKVKALLTSALQAGNVPIPADVDAQINATRKAFHKSWTTEVLDAHYKPLREVIASLSVDEMAELAETLVMLESLKEKVTSPNESVGGPIDVVAITKNEGFVWIKRKHYFDAAKNPRYLLRQLARYAN